jgi:hypothetical protein
MEAQTSVSSLDCPLAFRVYLEYRLFTAMLYQSRNPRGGSHFTWLRFAFALLLFSAPSTTQAADKSGDFSLLDLASHYTDRGTNVQDSIPKGKQTFDGVPFILKGRIELTGMNAARKGEFLPTEVTGVPVNAKAGRLHLILGARHGQKDGTPLGNVLLHYKNGEERSLRLAYGIHARNSFETNDVPTKKLITPNTTIAWEKSPGTNETAVRLYHAILSNPLPDEEIASIGFASLFNAATPIIFAATLEKSQEPLIPLARNKVVQHAFQFDDSTYRRPVTLHVTDASGKALADASAIATLQDDSRNYFFGEYHCDKGGMIHLSYPPQDAVALSLRVTRPGLVPAIVSLSFNDSAKTAGTMEVVLKRGVDIGGLVVDPTGNALSNVSVIPFLVRSTGSNQFNRSDLDTVQTRKDGTWSTAALPETLANLHFEVAHPEYHRAIIDAWPEADLLASKAKATLRPHLMVIGKVLNDQGNPLGNSTLILAIGTNHTWQYADARGEFKFVVPDPTNVSAMVMAIATNLAPAYQTVSLKSALPPVELKLAAGQKFSMRLTDQQSLPVPKVKVSLMSWAGSKAMQWVTETDKAGRFTWDHAPAGQVTFRFEKPGFTVLTYPITLPTSGETTLTYGRRVSIAGRVLDATSQKPIDQFRARIRYKYQNGSGSTSTTGKKGSFTYNIGGTKYDEATVIIEARGYQPVSATMQANESGSFSNLFLLKKGTPTPGFVVGPDGTPVVGAEVVLLDKSSYAYMEEPGKFRRGYSDYEVALSDARGRFELSPKLEPDFVIAAHRKLGFGQLPVSNLLAGAKLKLKPWGYVKGVLKVGDKIEPQYYASLNSASWSLGPDETRQMIYTYMKVKPQADGSFSFDAVPPGQRTVSLRYQNPDRDYGPTRLSHSVPIEVKLGETNVVVIGGTGRTVTGKLECTGPSAQQVSWTLYTQMLRPSYKSPSMLRPRIPPPNATLEERQRIDQEYQNAVMESNRRQQMQNNITYCLVCEEDGTFRVPNLPPGEYYLNVTAVVPSGTGNSGSYRHIGNLSQTVTVPEGTIPYDLGTFVVKSNQ